MLPAVEAHSEQAEVDFQNGCRLSILPRLPAAIERRLHNEHSLLFEHNVTFDLVLAE
jgi:hypothetical protein